MNTILTNGEYFVQVTEEDNGYMVELGEWNTALHPTMTQDNIHTFTEGVDYSFNECYTDVPSEEMWDLITDLLA